MLVLVLSLAQPSPSNTLVNHPLDLGTVWISIGSSSSGPADWTNHQPDPPPTDPERPQNQNSSSSGDSVHVEVLVSSASS